MIIEGEMDAMSAENALFSEITPQMQVNRNSLWHINIIYLCDKENLLMVMVVFNCTIDLPKLVEIILMAVHKRPKRDMQD